MAVAILALKHNKSNMRSILRILTISLLLCHSVISGEQLDKIAFDHVLITQVLTIYGEASGRDLVIASEVPKLNRDITLHVAPSVSKEECVRLIEQALLNQA